MTGEQRSGGWSEKDRGAIASAGLTIEAVERQLAIFREGVSPVRLLRPCTIGDGIAVLADEGRPRLMEVCEAAREDGRLLKFVPASGAASRMFHEWHAALAKGGFGEREEEENFRLSLNSYAFSSDLEKVLADIGMSLAQMITSCRYAELLDCILTDKGLNLGSLPKALLKFHHYPDCTRTAIEEHLVEAALYVRDENRIARIHFTVSGDHEKMVRERLLQVIRDYEVRFDTVFDFDISIQNPATNTLAVDLAGRPFRDEKGELLFRPSGHGALLMNLDSLDADIVFIKNIDNVVVDRYKEETVLWKKLLAGYLLTVQAELFHNLLVLENPNPAGKEIPGIAEFCREKLNIPLPSVFGSLTEGEKRHFLFDKLNRPLRVCGMVKNEGEPGGGPFWVESRGGACVPSLQIVEEVQIDREDQEQLAVWSSSTHFNPVDLVCGLRDYRGRKFRLADFVDQETSIITRKAEKGRDILALERPGLWNGSMAFWNTIFLEVPPATFAPIKRVRDLLRPSHQPSAE
ncbi:MAG: DUF4301 family protein [Syntrophobacterales bacterium]|nr:DUF4301 family protein [Syntrophobacterales bacterium]